MDLASKTSQNGSKITSQISNNKSDSTLKRMRSGSNEDDEKDESLAPKLPKNNGSSPLFTVPQTKMLSFSNPGSDCYYKNGGFGQRLDFSHCDYDVHTGYGSGVHAPLLEGGVGLFTASQWGELQHQALVYKYIQANAMVPSSLLFGLKRSVGPYVFSGLHSGSYSYAPNSWGWGGSFRLGYSGNKNDPEPGRCRRTDGKKWRCSRDAVPEQKYCERHLNRGRHRSRKLVEGRTGQAVAGTAATTSSSVISGSGAASKSLVVPARHQIENLQPRAADNPSTANLKFDRIPDRRGRSVTNPATDSKSLGLNFSIPKQRVAIEEPFHSGFGLVSSDSLVNPSAKSSYMDYNTTTFDPILHPFNENENRDQYVLRHFMDGEWPNSKSSRDTWPEELKPEWTQLSMSIPMSSGFSSSSSSSSPQGKVMLSPLTLSHEPDPSQKEMNLVPISWGNSMGGPLGEVLLNNTGSGNNVPAKNLPNGLGFGSPTGVLQKANFSSLSNSSSGSFPRGESRKMDGYDGPNDDIFGQHLTTSMFLPSL